MTETERPDPALRRAGLSATGETADELHVGESRAGTSYGDPAGPGTAHRETTSGDPEADLGQPSRVAHAPHPSESRDVVDDE